MHPLFDETFTAIFPEIFFLSLICLLCTFSGKAQQIILVDGYNFYGLDFSSNYCSYSLLNVPTCFVCSGSWPYSVALYKDTIYYNDTDGFLQIVLNDSGSRTVLHMDANTDAMTIH